jgi:hypothetical protein
MATNASTHASPVTPAEIDYLLRMLQNEDAESMRSKAPQRSIDDETTEEAPSTRTDRTCVKPLAFRLISKMVVHSIETTKKKIYQLERQKQKNLLFCFCLFLFF